MLKGVSIPSQSKSTRIKGGKTNLWTQCRHRSVREVRTVRHHQPGYYTATNIALTPKQSNKASFYESNKKGCLTMFLREERKKIKGEDPEVAPLEAGFI